MLACLLGLRSVKDVTRAQTRIGLGLYRPYSLSACSRPTVRGKDVDWRENGFPLSKRSFIDEPDVGEKPKLSHWKEEHGHWTLAYLRLVIWGDGSAPVGSSGKPDRGSGTSPRS